VTYYELSNHLGNVLVTVTDMKVGIEGGTNWEAEYYEATVVSANDYYPFGSAMAGRKYNDDSYRYGFNGMEKDDEVKGNGNSYDFGARIYDSRVGRWLSIDPLAAKYPAHSPYNGIGNNPILFLDPDGKEIVFGSTEAKKSYNELKAAYKAGGDKYKDRYDALIRLENSDKVVVNIYTKVPAWAADGPILDSGDGATRASKKQPEGGKIHLEIIVGQILPSDVDERVVMADELEHARQVLDGEMGVVLNEKKDSWGEKIIEVGLIAYDLQDEIKSREASIDAANALELDLTVDQKSLEKEGMEILAEGSSHYNRLPKESKTPDDIGKEKLQGQIDTNKATRIMYRNENNTAEDDNVILKKEE
jgi:RHS repeat-associated protein